MNDQKIKKIAIKQSVLEGGVAFIAVFIVMFVFFRYIHPIVPWEGDDWGTLGPFITTSEYGFPIGDEYEQIMPAMLATLMGYIAAFVVYPITGNYIAALTSVNAIALAITIAISIVAIYQFIRATPHRKVSMIQPDMI